MKFNREDVARTAAALYQWVPQLPVCAGDDLDGPC